jgi:hypothetical protein
MRRNFLAAIAALSLSACVGWQFAPELSFTSGESDGSTAMNNDPSWGSSSEGNFHAATLTLRAIAPVVLSETDRELVRGLRGGGGNVGVVMQGAERLTALTGAVEKERAAANALRDQVDHLEGDLRTRTRERDDARTEANDCGVALTKLRLELAAAQDWKESVDLFIDRYGLFGLGLVLLFAWLIVKARYGKRNAAPQEAPKAGKSSTDS